MLVSLWWQVLLLLGASGLRGPQRSRRISLRRASALTEENEDGSAAAAAATKAWDGTRTAVSVLAALGVAETSFLTWEKIGGATPLCGSAGCAEVLTGPYSSVGGVPLSAFGLLAYASVLLLALAPRLFPSLDAKTRAPLAVASSAMAAFSACLVTLILLKLQTSCVFCFSSAALSFSIFALVHRNGEALSKLSTSAGTALATTLLASLLFLYTEASIDAAELMEQFAVTVTTSGKQFAPPIVETKSTPRTIELASHLKATGAKMYGAYWCSHCFDQKEAFGAEALKDLPYLECAADGLNTARPVCQDRKVAGYPTWEIDGKLYPGEKSIAALEELSGFKSNAKK